MNEIQLALAGLHKRFGERVTAAGVDLNIRSGEFFTLLGPSGSGKSTLLRLIAGLEQPDSGKILVAGADVTRQPPWKRQLGMVFQQYANFPHMTVAENVGYGLRRQRLSRDERRQRVDELLALVGLEGFQNRRVTLLSGGEQQRVAIARALAPRPRLLLLDEPLSALDEKIRREMQSFLKDLQQATHTTFVYVTHDQEEALNLSDRLAVLNLGHVVQCDAPREVYTRPRTRFVADFFRGCNVLAGELVESSGERRFRVAGTEIPLPADPPAGPRPARPLLAVRGEDLLLGEAARDCPVVLEATLQRVSYRGLYSDHELVLDDGQRLSATRTGELAAVGTRMAVGVRVERVVELEAELY